MAEQYGKIEHAFDAVSEKSTYINICHTLDPHAAVPLVLPGGSYPEIPSTVTQAVTACRCAFEALDSDPWEKKAGTKTGERSLRT